MNPRVYVGNLPLSGVEEADIRDIFSTAGKIRDIWIARKPAGFAFVTFEDARDAEEAVEKLKDHEFQGQKLSIELSKGGRGDRDRGDRRDRRDRYDDRDRRDRYDDRDRRDRYDDRDRRDRYDDRDRRDRDRDRHDDRDRRDDRDSYERRRRSRSRSRSASPKRREHSRER